MSKVLLRVTGIAGFDPFMCLWVQCGLLFNTKMCEMIHETSRVNYAKGQTFIICGLHSIILIYIIEYI